MRFHFFETKKILESFPEKDNSTNQEVASVAQQVKHSINHSILFFIITTTFFMVIYSFIAYSFLETSSVLLINKHPYPDKEVSINITFKHQKECADKLFSKSTTTTLL